MVLRLDPRLPVVWRTPTSIQLGVSSPAVVMNDVTTADEHMIAALGTGVTESGLTMIGQSAGATLGEVEAFRRSIQPALSVTVERRAHRVLVSGTGITCQRIVNGLATSGLDVWVAGDVAAAEMQHCEFAVLVGHFVIDPALHGIWLRRDIPHLGVVLADTSVMLGPLVEPGRTACLYCLQFHATAADPAWPAIASQLWGRRSPADTELVAGEVAARTVRAVTDWFDSSKGTAQERMDVASGRVSTTEIAPHPDCGCLEAGVANALASATAAAISPAQPGTDSATAGRGGPAQRIPTAPMRG